MATRRFCGILTAVLITVLCSAGEQGSCVLLRGDTTTNPPSGIARLDFGMPGNPAMGFQEGGADEPVPARKSPWLAAGLSLVLPGSGEFYAGSYLKSALFFAAEAAILAIAYSYNHRGARQIDYVQDYANAHWSVVRYAQWTQDNLNPPHGPYNWLIPGTEGALPWLRVNWAELNRMESDLGALPATSYYSHVLPPFNQIEYYKVIGKYPQFNEGWDDAPPVFTYGDQLSGEFLYYSAERGKGNAYYITGSIYVGIAVVNHVVSALDAALTTGSYNRGLHASVESRTIPAFGGTVGFPAFCVRYGM